MANGQNTTTEVIRNGFEAITRFDIEGMAHITHKQSNSVDTGLKLPPIKTTTYAACRAGFKYP